jgi:hypothetical protein
MSKLRIATSLFALATSVALLAPAASASTPVPCSTAINGILDAGEDWLEVIATQVTARNGFGFVAFTMRDGFQIESTPLNTPAAGAKATFAAPRVTTDAFSGVFHEVFPERGNGDEDRASLWVGRNGNFWVGWVTWGGPWPALQRRLC